VVRAAAVVTVMVAVLALAEAAREEEWGTESARV
jgi:hypothetical protein